ncbi:hypothetical protein PHYPSEUDO_004880 [Phytophthora pseudosyringae]|uniref:Protein kinase domain-containing protein n=1 Tax=Phytophthora pseudosyringae TaxID=221518 RepID=A0A8T1VQE5_9STRA|nr:hypothetical protein PHYPSEUDO_004880 [Phytophthora pseudosyringae]
MVSLRTLQSTSALTGSRANMNSETNALTSATEGTSGTSTTAATSSTPSSNFTSVTTKKETTSSGQVITTVTSTTTTVSTSASSATSSTASSTATSSGATSSTKAATEGGASSVSTTTTTSTEGGNGGSPVTTVVTENGANATRTSTVKDAATGTTTVTTTIETDADSNGSASSSTMWVTTSSGPSATTGERSGTTVIGTSQETSSAAGASTSITTSSSVGATKEGASTSTIPNTGSITGASTSTEGDSASLTTTSGTATNSEATTSGSATTSSNTNYPTASSSTGASSTSTSISTRTGSSTAATTASSRAEANAATTSRTITSSSTGSANGAATTTTTISSIGSNGSSSVTETSASSSTTTSTEGSLGSVSNSLSGSRSMATSSSSSYSSSSSSSTLTSWFTSNFRDEETQLVVGSKSSTTTTDASHQVCNGLPALVTRSSTGTPNGGCPDELTALNASCTCITGYSNTASSWAFRITTESWNSTTTTTTHSRTQSSSDELTINTIRPIWVSSSLKTLEIEGAGETPAEISFINENRVASGSSLALVRSASNSTNVSTLSIYNIDLHSVAAKSSDFVPATVTNLTLRDCNISTLSTSFTRDWSWLQYLDLSSNNIDTEFIGGADLKELNLSHNALAVFPAGSLNTSGLEALYIQGNSINDFNVSQDQFEQIQALTDFTADQPQSSSTCEAGAWQSAHGTTFCVLGASTAAVPDSSRSSGSNSDDDHDGLGLLAYWLIVGAIVVFFLLLLVIWQRRRHSRERESSPIVSPEAVEPTTPKYNANAAFGDALNRDNAAAVVAPAAVGAAAYPGYGRSHGNSVDSEVTALGATLVSNPVLAACRLDYAEVTLGRCISRGGFGLVFVGSYRGRQVAVKKIRNEREVEREQVEQFVREISLISGLNHPRIVEFIGACWTTPAELSAVTELMERGDLRDVTRRFKRRGYRLTWEAHKTVIALHIAEAMTYLHGLSPTVIHRDLKAKNVLLNADMEAKLSDFGIARERSLYDGSEHMTVGIGTSFWIAPEVLLGRDYDERADIYSFGVVLSELDTDDYPYWNATNPPGGKVQENEILRLVARGAKRPAFSDDCPPAVLELAARCLRADPQERPSASEIVVYLQQLVQERTSSASFPSMVRPGQSFDLSTRSTTTSNSPTRTAPANTIVNLRSSSGQPTQQSQAMSVPSSAAATAYAAGKRSTKTTTTTIKTMAAYSSVGAAEALVPAHEMVESSSPQVTHQVVRTKLPPKGKRTTTTTTTTTTRRAGQGSTSSSTGGYFITGMAMGISEGGQHDGTESAMLDNLNQQRQMSSSSGEEEKRHSAPTKWVLYEDAKEL